jgi:hypothetical protein
VPGFYPKLPRVTHTQEAFSAALACRRWIRIAECEKQHVRRMAVLVENVESIISNEKDAVRSGLLRASP